jgi:hypothetical protein
MIDVFTGSALPEGESVFVRDLLRDFPVAAYVSE